MIKKLMIALLSMFFVACGILMIVVFLYFLIPNRKAAQSISLPTQVEDSANLSAESTTEDSGTYDNIYLADVQDYLSLRDAPDVSGNMIAELKPMTKMQLITYIDGQNFAYVEVINGDYQGQKGYVNCAYITKMGDETIRVGTE